MNKLIEFLEPNWANKIEKSFHNGKDNCELKLVDNLGIPRWFKIMETINYLLNENNKDLFSSNFPEFIKSFRPYIYGEEGPEVLDFSYVMSFSECRKVVENPKDFTNKIKITFKDME